MACIYEIVNKIDKKFYIGSANNFRKRKQNHISYLRNNKHGNIHLQRAWNKYGEENFEFNILEEINEKDKFKLEQEYLDALKPFGNKGYNILKNAGGFYKLKIIEKKCYFLSPKDKLKIEMEYMCNFESEEEEEEYIDNNLWRYDDDDELAEYFDHMWYM